MATVRRNPGNVDLGDMASYSTAALPSAGDTLYFGDGNDAYVTNMNALAAIDLAVLAFAPQWKGKFDTTAMAVTCDRSDSGVLKFEGSTSGTCKFTGGSTNKVYKILWYPTAGARGEFTNVVNQVFEITGGSALINSGCTLVNVYVMGGDLVIDTDGSDTVTGLYCYGGRTTIKRAFTTLYVGPGATVYIDTDTYAGGTINCEGGVIVWYSGNLMTMLLKKGVLDVSKFRRSGQVVQNFESWATAQVLVSSGGLQPTVGSVTTTPRGSDRGAVIMSAGSGGGAGFGLTG